MQAPKSTSRRNPRVDSKPEDETGRLRALPQLGNLLRWRGCVYNRENAGYLREEQNKPTPIIRSNVSRENGWSFQTLDVEDLEAQNLFPARLEESWQLLEENGLSRKENAISICF
eukprot:344580-Pleurochrysis_carterae.AAC.1